MLSGGCDFGPDEGPPERGITYATRETDAIAIIEYDHAQHFWRPAPSPWDGILYPEFDRASCR